MSKAAVAIAALLQLSGTLAGAGPATGVVEGRVVGPENEPLAGARVEAWTPNTLVAGARVGTAATESDGRYRLDHLPRGPVEIRAWHPGHYAPAPVLVDLARGASRAPDLRLAQGATIRGTVRDAAGAPLRAEIFTRDLLSRSDANGLFVLDGLEPDSVVEMWVDVPGQGSARQRARAGQSNVSIVIARAECRTIRVLVEGQPLGGRRAEALWIQSGGGGESSASTLPDGDGTLRMCGAPGTYDLSVEVAGRAREHVAGVKVPGGDLVVDLAPGPAVAGRVSAPEGRAVAGAELVLLQQGGAGAADRRHRLTTTRTDADGRFRVAGFERAPLAVAIEAAGFLRQEIRLDEPDDRLEIALDPGAVLGGRVVGGDGAPVGGAEVAISQEGLRLPSSSKEPSRDPAWSPRAVTDASGGFTIHGMPRGIARVAAMAPDGRRTAPARVVVDPEQDPPPLTLTLASAGRIEGSVLGVPASRLSEATVEARSPEGETWSASLQDGGAFVIDPVPDGPVTIEAKLGDAAATASVEVSRQEPVARVELSLCWGPALDGIVVRRKAPVADLQLDIRSEGGSSVRTRSDADGRFTARGLEPGAARVLVALGDHEHASRGATHGTSFAQRVELADGVVVVALPAETLRGRVVHARTGSPIEGALVDALSTVGDDDEVPRASVTRGGSTDAEGRFQVEGLLTGRTLLAVDAPSHATWLGEVSAHADSGVVIRLEPERRVLLVLVDPTGARIRGARFRIAGDSALPLDLPTESVGQDLLVRGVGATPVDIVVSGEGVAPDVLHDLAGPAERTLQLSAGGTLEVRHEAPARIVLEDAEGRALPFGLGGGEPVLAHVSNRSPALLTVRSGDVRVRVGTGEEARVLEAIVREGETSIAEAR